MSDRGDCEAHELPAGVTISDWHEHAPDLSLATLSLQGSALFSAELLLARTSLNKFRVSVIRASDFGSRRTDVRSMCKASKARLCINANFFDESGQALGLVVSRGIVHQRLHNGGKLLSGIFSTTREKFAIVERSGFSLGDTLEAVQAGPIIVKNGQAVQNIRETQSPSRRAGVCIDSADRLVFFCRSSGLRGISIAELQQALLIPEIGCKTALNFDGGGSAQMFIDSFGSAESTDPIYIPGGDIVPVSVGLHSVE